MDSTSQIRIYFIFQRLWRVVLFAYWGTWISCDGCACCAYLCMVSNKDSRKSRNSSRPLSFPNAVVFCSMCLANSIRAGLFIVNHNKFHSLITSKSKEISVPLLKISLILSILHIPGTAYSCAVCFSGSEESLQAYYLTTVFLTLLPLLMLASIGYWIYRKHRGN